VAAELALQMSDATKRVLEALDLADAPKITCGIALQDAPEVSFRPHPRPGLPIGQMNPQARKAVYQLLSLAVSAHTFAQMITIMGFEEVLDRNASWAKCQQSGDYYFAIYGNPGVDPWMWRLEGHHLSISVKSVRGNVYPTPLFLGANPDNVEYHGRSVLRPLAAEDELGFAVMNTLTPQQRANAWISTEPPVDVQFFRVAPLDFLAGVRADKLGARSRQALAALVDVYIGRFSEKLFSGYAWILEHPELRFSWTGSDVPGQAHNYRIAAGEDLLIEYGNNYHGQMVANHSHSFIRFPNLDGAA
jgi:hypothetical protein